MPDAPKEANLPELPAPWRSYAWGGIYSSEHMRDYARAAVAAERAQHQREV